MKKIILSFVALMGVMALMSFIRWDGRTALTGEKMIYEGRWIDGNSDYIQIDRDGTGEIKQSGMDVIRGRVAISGDFLTISNGLNKFTMKIIERPHETPNGWKMSLDNCMYMKSGFKIVVY